MDTLSPRRGAAVVLLALALLGLYAISLHSFLLFHTLVELFSVVVAMSLFVIAWHTRVVVEDHYLLFLGIAYAFVGMLDLVHTLAYDGMGVFVGHGANLPTQLWIAARYMEAGSLLLAPRFLHRRTAPAFLVVAYAVCTGALLLSILAVDWFPDCFVPPHGLTTWKRASEYVICVLLVGAMVRTYRHRAQFDHGILALLLGAMGTTVVAELFFTWYVHVYGISNLAGHFLKLASFLLVYKALVESSLRRPYLQLFRQLKQSEEQLREEKEQLQQALAEIRALEGMLPICAHCKRIRTEAGDWVQVERYLHERSGTDFSHGICPQCARQYYPGLCDGQ